MTRWTASAQDAFERTRKIFDRNRQQLGRYRDLETPMIHFSALPGSPTIADRQGSANATRRALPAGGAAAVGLGTASSVQASVPQPSTEITHKWVRADGVDVFYREAGLTGAPVLLLLHGFANSSFYFRHLMPKLADRFRLIAPDLPSFGFTQIPAERDYRYDFESLSRTIAAFVDALELKRYMLYVFDYGAPVGWDLALIYPDRVAGIISQNGNAYVEGLRKEAWDPLRAYWASPSPDKREPIRARMTLEGVKAAYFHGVADPSTIEPEFIRSMQRFSPGRETRTCRSTSSSTTSAISSAIRSIRISFVSGSRSCSPFGERTIRSLPRRAPRRSNEIFPLRVLFFWIPVTLRSRQRATRYPTR